MPYPTPEDNPALWLQLWGHRLERLGPELLSTVTGLPAARIARLLAAHASEAGLEVNDKEASLYRYPQHLPQPEFMAEGMALRIIIARTVAFAERHPGSMPSLAHEDAYCLRRYVLRTLGLLLRPTAGIAELRERPWREQWKLRQLIDAGEELPPESEEERARRERRAALAESYRERATRIRDAWLPLLPAADPDRMAMPEGHVDASGWPPLPAHPADLERNFDVLSPRFGPPMQMLAFSKSRAPWSSRCIFNARIRLGDRAPFWSGDMYFFPPDAARDPKRAALEVSAHYGEPVSASPEHGSVQWTAYPDGSLRYSDRGRETLTYGSLHLERDGWPEPGRWELLPAEIPVGR
jgi:hypothetical protein